MTHLITEKAQTSIKHLIAVCMEHGGKELIAHSIFRDAARQAQEAVDSLARSHAILVAHHKEDHHKEDEPLPSPPEGCRVFTACRYLTFNRAEIVPETVMVQVSTGPGKATKVCWDRWNGESRELAQICKKIGVLHGPMNCLDEKDKRCDYYEEITHEVPYKDIDLS